MGMDLTIGFVVVLGLLEVLALFYLWRTNRRLDTVTAELREEIDATIRCLKETHLAMSEHVDEVVEELWERLRIANQRLDRVIEAAGMAEDVSDQTVCFRGLGGKSRRLRRSDHRQ